jgi:hypothetical protein
VLKRLVDRLRKRREVTAEDERAHEDARRMKSDVETLRMGGLGGPGMISHGGKDATGRDR